MFHRLLNAFFRLCIATPPSLPAQLKDWKEVWSGAAFRQTSMDVGAFVPKREHALVTTASNVLDMAPVAKWQQVLEWTLPAFVQVASKEKPVQTAPSEWFKAARVTASCVRSRSCSVALRTRTVLVITVPVARSGA